MTSSRVTPKVDAEETTQAGGALRLLLRERRLVGLDSKVLSFVGVTAAFAGLVQAVILLLIVRAATALTASVELTSGSLGPLALSDLTVGNTVALAGGLLVVLFALESANSWGQAVLQASSQRSARRRMLAAYSKASFAEQSALARGDMQQVLNLLPGQVGAVVGQLGAGVSAALSFVVLAAAALLLSPSAAVTVVVGVGVLMALQRPILIAGRRSGDRHTRSQRDFGTLIAERLEISNEVVSFGVGGAAAAPVEEHIGLVSHRLQRLRFLSRMSSVAYRVGALALVLAMLALVARAESSNFAALTGAMLMLLRSVSYGQAVQTGYQALNEAVPVIRQLVAERDRLTSDRIDTGSIEPAEFGTLALADVSFAYPGQPSTLRHVDLMIEPGDFMAIVGPSGSGKSTIMSLLLGLRHPTAGAVELDGVDVRTITSDWWHRQVAFVPQESRLQAGTVREAIRFFRPWITDTDIERAASLARIGNEIDQWPDGYDTEVGQSGDRLSGGQRQRIALARALAGRPQLLLLDEPTSALDPTSEVLIREALDSIQGETTIVVIAHRPETVKHATRIVRVDAGVPTEASDADLTDAVPDLIRH
ncbi:MAG: ABC transporter ATP-binding protein/permease [Actinomycetota bacterium]